MLFSDVKISSFRAKAPLVFHCCLYDKKNHSEEQFKNMWFLRADSLGSCGRKAFSYKNVFGFKIIRISVRPRANESG